MKKKVVPMIHVPDVRATVDWYQGIGFTIGATYADETGENLSFAIMSFGDTEVMFNTGGETSTKQRREVDPERVRAALASGSVKPDTLNVALAFVSGASNKNEQIIAMLTGAGARPAPEVSIETLESYVGSYKGEHGLAAEITLKDGRLFATPAGQQPMSVWPLDQVTFKTCGYRRRNACFQRPRWQDCWSNLNPGWPPHGI